jgi:UDP:flavonoid glycosyltransferase YjiC (YdhE family)
MSRYLAYTSPARGHLYPLVPTLLELRARGHEVVLRTISSEVDRMAGLGFGAGAIDPAIEAIEHDDWRARTPLGGLRRSLETLLARAPLEVEDIERAVEEESPDALIVDVNCFGGAAAAAGTLPRATYCPYLLPLPSRDAPPYGLGLPPAGGLAGRVRDRLLAAPLTALYDRWLVPGLNELRAGLGLDPLRHAADAWLEAPLLVYYTAEPLEYPRSDWPSSVRMVGPGIWDPPADEPDWLSEAGDPWVLVTASTEFQDDGRLIQAALDALAGEDVRVIATTAGVDPAPFTAPPNARVERFAPHGPILARAACVVCHGGMGITSKALVAGVPLCVVPFGRDQLEVARHVEVSGAGTRLSAGRLRADRLRAAVREATGLRGRAREVAERLGAAGGPAAAAGALEELLAGEPAREAPGYRAARL